MNEGIHLDPDTWIVPGQIRKANLCRGWETDTHQPVPFISYPCHQMTTNDIRDITKDCIHHIFISYKCK